MNVFIYYLSDKNGEIRYVGKTKQFLKQRLYAHIIECKTEKKSHKISWIKSLLNKGERPIINIIDEVPENDWTFWEEYWISQFKSWGFNLTNLTTGGQGGNGYKHTNESKQKMRKSKLGITLTQEQKKKISDSVKNKAKDSPNYNKCYDRSIFLDRDILYQKYIIENLSMPKCAKIFNVSEKTIFRNLKEFKIKKDKFIWKEQCSSHPKKVVLQYDMEKNLIKEWIGLRVIESELKINKSNIANCCRGLAKSAGGFIWKYKSEN